MVWRIFKKNKKGTSFVEPDEIFLDSKNIQNFDRQQFEGRIEKTIPKRTIFALGILFIFFCGVFGSRLIYLQVSKGEAYFDRSQNNVLEKVLLFADRGIIYDRNKKELTWNTKTEESAVPQRSYISPGFSHLLGYVSYPAKDSSGFYWQADFIGKDGLEKQYNDVLTGINGAKIIETDARGKTYSENIVNTPKQGTDLVTSVDSGIQQELFRLIKNLADNHSFSGGAGVVMDVHNGEILASTSFPEYNSEILSSGEDKAVIHGYLTDKRKTFLERDISGLYTPGSIVKPFFALAALSEGVIDPYKEILSTGSISVPNPYFPNQETVFKDWRVNGWTNMMEALAVSSDIYFYVIGGGFEGQKGVGILKLEEYSKLFGMAEKTGIDRPDEKSGVIPSPAWKLATFDGDPWRLGDTYHTAIGQYGFQVTPLEMARATAAIANGGSLLTPHLVLDDKEKEKIMREIPLQSKYYELVRQGMREAVTYGTAAALNVPYVEVAAKTGTAQVGISKNKVNSWIIGFFPYENPKYAFTVIMEAGPAVGTAGASSVMRGLLDWISLNTPTYFE